MMETIRLNHNRNGLIEGRTKGIAIGFVKKNDTGIYETLTPISPCKDYINDVVYIETRNKPLGKIYGFKHERLGFLGKVNHLGVKCYQNDIDEAAMLSNYQNMQIFMNKIEDMLGIKDQTVIKLANSDMLLVDLAMDWCSQPYMISLYGLLLRVCIKYNGKDDVIDYLKQPNVYGHSDFCLINPNVLNKINQIIELGIVEQKYSVNNPLSVEVHNTGIVGVKLS